MSDKTVYTGGWANCAKAGCGGRVKRSADRQVGERFYHLDHLPAKGKVVDADDNRMSNSAAWSGGSVYSEKKYGDSAAEVRKMKAAAARERKAAVKARQTERANARKAKAAAKAAS